MTKTKTKKTRTRPFDAARYLSSDQDIAAYLDAVLEDGDPKVIGRALGDIARAKGMTNIARATGMSRESLYKALSPDGNPEMATFLKVIRAFGLQLHTSEA
ncbi:MAG TPA: addiction module antidote protein [Terriglobales bacterium]|nr:addiction module antidote protein [Terriglobales bacterium]